MDRRQDKQHSIGLCLRLREKLPLLGCKLQGVLQPFLFCVQNPGFANEVGSRIKNLNDELATIYQGAAYRKIWKRLNSLTGEPARAPPVVVVVGRAPSVVATSREVLVIVASATATIVASSSIILMVCVGNDFDELKDIGMKIIRKCDGLPLAIKVMGGLLSTRDPNEREWEIVLHKNLGWEEEDGTQEELNYSLLIKRAKISNKKNLEYLELSCYKVDEDEAAEEIGDTGNIRYFGRRLPNWLQSAASTTFKSLKGIDLLRITHCTRLPDGLGRIHGLEELRVIEAPAIEHVGPEFQTHDAARGDGGVAFPNLRKLVLDGLSGWKEWGWVDEEQSKVIAMPALESLDIRIRDCKLTHLPPGLASDRRHNLRTIILEELTLREYVENFPGVVELVVCSCPELKRISGLAKLRTVDIDSCPKLKLKLLKGVRALDSLELDWEHWEVAGADARCTPNPRPRDINADGRVSSHKTLLYISRFGPQRRLLLVLIGLVPKCYASLHWESEDSGAPLDANKGTREQALAVLDGVLYADTGINDLSPQPT
ncbi:hypothetical protein D1007_48756 [Hordeum vulgare]|nr:hypothetical protein D1007_48756 [Hordeum vulgare]